MVLPIPISLGDITTHLNLLFTRNISGKFISESHKTIRSVMKKRQDLTRSDFRDVIQSCQLTILQAGKIADRKKNPRDKTQISLELQADLDTE